MTTDLPSTLVSDAKTRDPVELKLPMRDDAGSRGEERDESQTAPRMLRKCGCDGYDCRRYTLASYYATLAIGQHLVLALMNFGAKFPSIISHKICW